MILTKYIEQVGYVVVANDEHECIISASSPLVLSQFLQERGFDIKKHDAALLVRYKSSEYVLFLEHITDVPMKNVYDPTTGKLLILYEIEEKTDALVRIN